MNSKKCPALCTPDDRFNNLPGFAFDPHYIDNLPGYEGLRIHYVDEGPRNAANTFLCLHGEPTWGYLYRKMIPIFLEGGNRVIAPDFLGFGRSDKPAEESIYTFNFHRNMLISFIERLCLNQITLVCQDWGGLLGLTLPVEMPGRFTRLIAMNTTLATGELPLGEPFLKWRKWNNQHPDIDLARFMKNACPHLSPAEAAAYAAPFPDIHYKSGVRRFPNIVPDSPSAEGAEISKRAREWWKNEWQGQTFMAIGMRDEILGPKAMKYFSKQVKGCPPPYEVNEAGHFVQEWGEVVARRALESFKKLEI